jgi:hypothetical protein
MTASPAGARFADAATRRRLQPASRSRNRLRATDERAEAAKISPRLAELLARMLAAKLSAEQASQPASDRGTVPSPAADRPQELHDAHQSRP